MADKAPRPRPRGYQKHGLHLLKRAVKGLGGRVIDRRTTLGRALQSWRGDLVADLGGREALSTQQVSLIELAVRTKLMVDSIDSWILSQPSLVDKRRRALLPVVRERASLASSFRDLLKDLGLERRAAPVMTLAEIMRSPPKEAEPVTETVTEEVSG